MGLFKRNPFATPADTEGSSNATNDRDSIAAEYQRRGASQFAAREAATAIMRPGNDRSDSDTRAIRRVGQEIDQSIRDRLRTDSAFRD